MPIVNCKMNNGRRKTDNYDYNMNSNDNANKRYSDNPINNNTIINLDNSTPIGIDLNRFMGCDADQTIHSISQSNDLPIISELSEQHQSFKGIVAKRLNSLKMISGWWSNSDFSSAFNAINMYILIFISISV